jgi:glutathione S-transferase
MYGKGLKEAAAVDEVVDGVEDLKAKYLALIYQDELVSGKSALPRCACGRQ